MLLKTIDETQKTPLEEPMVLTRTLLGLCLLRQISAVLRPTSEEFTELVNEEKLMLVGFTALSWCPHCKKVPEIFTRVETLFQKKGVDIKTVILDDSEDKTKKHVVAYNIIAHPTILLVRGSKSSLLITKNPQRLVAECVEKMQDCQGDLPECRQNKQPLQQVLDNTMKTF
ncbi:MAG: putative protein disulfide isomerase [Amphiamblys sp. WSBS2006]|nr:MAG: putative protein disulfide isomerase [Amphiamblys sp. WSBS2006]